MTRVFFVPLIDGLYLCLCCSSPDTVIRVSKIGSQPSANTESLSRENIQPNNTQQRRRQREQPATALPRSFIRARSAIRHAHAFPE